MSLGPKKNHKRKAPTDLDDEWIKPPQSEIKHYFVPATPVKPAHAVAMSDDDDVVLVGSSGSGSSSSSSSRPSKCARMSTGGRAPKVIIKPLDLDKGDLDEFDEWENDAAPPKQAARRGRYRLEVDPYENFDLEPDQDKWGLSEEEKKPKKKYPAAEPVGNGVFYIETTISINKLASNEEMEIFTNLGKSGMFKDFAVGLTPDQWMAVLEATKRKSYHELSVELQQEMMDHVAAAVIPRAVMWNAHYHFWVHLKTKRRPKNLERMIQEFIDQHLPTNKCRVASRPVSLNGQEAIKKYIYKKDGTFVAGPWSDQKDEFGGVDEKDFITKTNIWQHHIETLLLEGFKNDRSIHRLNDQRGFGGKTSFAKYLRHRYPKQVGFIRAAKDADIAQAVLAQGNKLLWIVMLPRTLAPSVSIDELNKALEGLKDGEAVNTKYHFKEKEFKSPDIWILHNDSPIGKSWDKKAKEYKDAWTQDRVCDWYLTDDGCDFTEESYINHHLHKDRFNALKLKLEANSRAYVRTPEQEARLAAMNAM